MTGPVLWYNLSRELLFLIRILCPHVLYDIIELLIRLPTILAEFVDSFGKLVNCFLSCPLSYSLSKNHIHPLKRKNAAIMENQTYGYDIFKYRNGESKFSGIGHELTNYTNCKQPDRNIDKQFSVFNTPNRFNRFLVYCNPLG